MCIHFRFSKQLIHANPFRIVPLFLLRIFQGGGFCFFGSSVQGRLGSKSLDQSLWQRLTQLPQMVFAGDGIGFLRSSRQPPQPKPLWACDSLEQLAERPEVCRTSMLEEVGTQKPEETW